MAKVVIFGTQDFAQLAHFYLTHDSDHEVVAFTLDKDYLTEPTFQGLPVVPFETMETVYPPDDYLMFLPLSPRNLNQFRAEKVSQAKAKGYSLISYISSKATYYGTPVGENAFIFENNVIQPFTEIGNNVIMWSGNHFGHHSVIEDHCFVASHVVISGHVRIGKYSFLGVNATINNGITIAERNVIGSGALIVKSTEPGQVYPGIRAQVSATPSDQIRSL